MQLDAIRSEIYLLLSEGFKNPTASYVTEQNAIVGFLENSFAALKYPIPRMLYENWSVFGNNLGDLQQAYQRSFVFPHVSRVVPVESVFRRWTYDTTGNVPFAAEKGFLLSDHALHLRELYQAYGITIPDDFQATPDHICLELEFAAFLINHASPERLTVFVHEHLSWLEDLCLQAQSAEIPSYYRQLIELTAQFVKYEQEYLDTLKF